MIHGAVYGYKSLLFRFTPVSACQEPPRVFSETVVYLSGFIIYFSLGPRGPTIKRSAECCCCGVGDVSAPTVHNIPIYSTCISNERIYCARLQRCCCSIAFTVHLSGAVQMHREMRVCTWHGEYCVRAMTRAAATVSPLPTRSPCNTAHYTVRDVGQVYTCTRLTHITCINTYRVYNMCKNGG